MENGKENPELSTATDLLDKHNLNYHKVTKSSVGFINQVFLSEDYVVKIYHENNYRGYKKELWFYKEIHPEYAPKLIGYGDNYLIIERIQGQGLYRLWRDMNDVQREETVRQIANIIQQLNQVNITGELKELLDFKENWRQALIDNSNWLYDELNKNNGIPDELAHKVREYIYLNTEFLEDNAIYLVHPDLHFDNLLVTEDNKLYLIDYEMLRAAPKDYILDVWQRMTIHPFTYANDEDHKATLPKDYIHIMEWLRIYAPELFEHPKVKERVNIYCMLYELNILRYFPNGEWPIERLKLYLSE